MVGVAVTPICWGTPLMSDGLNIGFNTVDADSYSIAAGMTNEAWGGSIAIGDTNIVLANGGAAFGVGNGVLGTANSALGAYQQMDINSSYSTLLGIVNESIASYGVVATGEANLMKLEVDSFIAGYTNTMASAGSYGRSNIILGSNNVIHKDDTDSEALSVESSVLIGAGNEASDSFAWAIGKGNLAQANTVTLGTYALQVSNASLIVGNGASGARSNGLVVLKNGTVNIPSGILQLNGESALTSTSAQSVIGIHLSAHNYLRREQGLDASAWAGSLAAWGEGAIAYSPGSLALGVGSWRSRSRGWRLVTMLLR